MAEELVGEKEGTSSRDASEDGDACEKRGKQR